MKKRSFLQLWLGSLLASPAFPSFAAAFPERPIKLVVPFPPGGLVSTIAFAVANRMSTVLGQPIVLDPKPGAAGTIAANFVAKAPKDGYTLLLGTSAMLGISKYMYKDLPYDPVADFSPVGIVGNVTVGVFASQKSGIESLDDLLQKARAKPGTINFGSPGVGSVSHLAGELLKSRAKLDIVHVPYAGNTPQMTDLIGGQTQIGFTGVGSGISFAKDGRIKLLAVAAKSRSKSHPTVPALGEILPGYNAPAWLGIVAAKGTPADVMERLEAALQEALGDRDIKALFDAQGIDLESMSARAFGEKMRSEMSLWQEAVKASGAQPTSAK